MAIRSLVLLRTSLTRIESVSQVCSACPMSGAPLVTQSVALCRRMLGWRRHRKPATRVPGFSVSATPEAAVVHQ